MPRPSAVVLLVTALAAFFTAQARAQPLETAVFDPTAFAVSPTPAFAHVAAAGAGSVRILVELGAVAPGGATKPDSFDPTDPSSPGYNWANTDAQVTAAVAAGLRPILCLTGAPQWAASPSMGPKERPNLLWYGRFAEGAARRYSGSFGGLPRVSYWQAWNEPNLGTNLTPQRGDAGLLAPNWYRGLVNAFARGVKRVDPTNLVIAGGLAPYAATIGPGIPPLTFMKQFLCVSGFRIRPRPACVTKTTFDIWAMQPYTWGGPTHHATVEGDIALGDLPAMRSVLDQAAAAGRIVSPGLIDFWVTEFSWDTNPPDPGGVDIGLQTRWTAEALYRMWQSGVSLVTWFLIRDMPFPERFQSGLYYAGSSIEQDVEKPTLLAFRFPVTAFSTSGGVTVWCRTPFGAPGSVRIQQDTGSGVWSSVAVLSSDSNGIVSATIPLASTAGDIRAQVVATDEMSAAFSLTAVPDQPVDPFGD